MTDNTETVTLSRPIKAHGGDVSEIKLKEPTARSFFSHGEPFKVKVLTDDKGESLVDFDFNNAVFAKFLSDMTGLDDIVLSGMRAVDYVGLRARAAHMIIGVAGTNFTET
jgi:Phage tail assembly chaperone proteins, E, or 41 or 14